MDQLDFAAAAQRRLADWNEARQARPVVARARETGRADLVTESFERLRDFNIAAARAKADGEQSALLFACHELLARNIGTSTIFAGLTDDDLVTLAGMMATFIGARR